jgi:hypothetical protein
MRIAICFSGQIRSGVQAAPNIKRYIGDLLPICDFFLHTWDHQSPPTAPNDLQLVDKSVFAEFYKLYNPISMTVEPYKVHRLPDGTWAGARVDSTTGKKYVSMFESIRKVNNLKIAYEKDNGFVYDYVVRIRTDLIFHPDKSLRNDIGDYFGRTLSLPDSDNIFMTAFHRGDHPKLEDVFWIAKSPTMDKLANFSIVRADSGVDVGFDWQQQIADWVTNELKLTFYKLQNSSIRIMRMDQTHCDPLNFDLYAA